MIDRESYNAIHIDMNSTVVLDTSHVAGFAPATGGNITIEVRDQAGAFTLTPIDGVHLSPGSYMQLPLSVPYAAGIRVTLSGGGGGTLFY